MAGSYYGIVQNLLQDVENPIIAEIGVAYGYHAENILHSLPDATFYGIDPYLAGYDQKDPLVQEMCSLLNEHEPQRAMDRVYAVAADKLTAFGNRARLLRQKSVQAAAGFADGFFDLVFIDGEHTYEAVQNDLRAWWGKVKSPGILCGDDYSWADVRRAVDEFSASRKCPLEISVKRGTNYPIWVLRK
jgi:predicted O-methyltransferase YrrM